MKYKLTVLMKAIARRSFVRETIRSGLDLFEVANEDTGVLEESNNGGVKTIFT